jgi:hypothetical protein
MPQASIDPQAIHGTSSSIVVVLAYAILLLASPVWAAEEQTGENASNPLSKGRNTDLRYQYFDLVDGSDRHDGFIDGAFMATDKLKVKYEVHYWETNVTGRSEHDWEKLVLKPIYFPNEGTWGTWKYRLAVGLEWTLDANNDDKGIGSGSDQLSPFVGAALVPRPGTTLIPLVQQFLSYSGNDVNTTSFRLIALQVLPNDFWVKPDVKLPIDWENDNAIPATLEVQLGKHMSDSLALYGDVLAGIGGDRPYEYGLGLGLRFKY